MNKTILAVLLALAADCVDAQSNSAAISGAGTVTNICGRRVILSYKMPIPNDNLKTDVTTWCYVEGYDRKDREFRLPLKLDEFSVVIPKDLAPFRKEAVVLKDGPEAGTRHVHYQPEGNLFRKRLAMTVDSRGKLRQFDFHGDIQLDLTTKTISVVLSDRSERNEAEQGGGHVR